MISHWVLLELRRERLAHEGAINAQIVRETMPLYDPTYRKWLISEKNQEENVSATKFIIIETPHFYPCPDGSHEKEANAIKLREELKAQTQKQEALKKHSAF